MPNTRAIEAKGRALVSACPKVTAHDLRAFSKDVCVWGGRTGMRVYGRIRSNSDMAIVSGFTAAIGTLLTGGLLGIIRPGAMHLGKAKTDLGCISGLGRFSYASKHLRMLNPENSAVLDSVINKYLLSDPLFAHSSEEQRYLGYCDFCEVKALKLTAAGVKLGDYLTSKDVCTLQHTTKPAECRWTAGDVDMACFAWLQKWCPGVATSVNDSGGTSGLETVCTPHGNGKPLLKIQHSSPGYWGLRTECKSPHAEKGQNHWGNLSKPKSSLGVVLALTFDAVAKIALHGGNFPGLPAYKTGPNNGTGGGKTYDGHAPFGSVAAAIKYLSKYFDICACDVETKNQLSNHGVNIPVCCAC